MTSSLLHWTLHCLGCEMMRTQACRWKVQVKVGIPEVKHVNELGGDCCWGSIPIYNPTLAGCSQLTYKPLQHCMEWKKRETSWQFRNFIDQASNCLKLWLNWPHLSGCSSNSDHPHEALEPNLAAEPIIFPWKILKRIFLGNPPVSCFHLAFFIRMFEDGLEKMVTKNIVKLRRYFEKTKKKLSEYKLCIKWFLEEICKDTPNKRWKSKDWYIIRSSWRLARLAKPAGKGKVCFTNLNYKIDGKKNKKMSVLKIAK